MTNTDVDNGEGEPLPPLVPPPLGPPRVITGPPADELDLGTSAALIALQAQIAALTAEVAALKTTQTKQGEDTTALAARSALAIEAMPCPNGVWLGLPATGWTGRPENAPGAYPATIAECMQAGHCNCQTGQALIRTGQFDGSS